MNEIELGSQLIAGLSVIILVGFVMLLVLLVISRKNLKNSYDALKNDAQVLENRISSLQESNTQLSRFQCCIDAEAEAEAIKSSAEKKATDYINDAKYKASQIIHEASEAKTQSEQETLQIVAEAKEKIENTQAICEENLSASLRKCSELIAGAEAKARSIAGEAYDIAQKADYYRQVASAMKNIIQGYGNSYLKPTESLLDSLANEFGFDDAGRELILARNISQKMITEGLAATCDYVESYRRKTAIEFILDAFNGKVDSILSRLKKDNYGILEQKIRDAYATVNYLGQAFRNARITEEYLSARLIELKWGVAVMALKEKAKEEQRRIKEQMREEERARREYERAIKDAAKDEETLRKAMEKARSEIAKANDLQKAKYEAKLLELEQKLQEAEARSQRAMSMAQQTRSGHVYIISNIGSFGEDVYKIGMTRRLEPLDRVRELGDASVPFPFDVHAMIFSDDAPTLESELHRLFARNQLNKVNPRKEFFRVNISDIKNVIDKKNKNVSWTLTAQAAQYRESLAIEASWGNDKEAESMWEKTQIDNSDYSRIYIED